MPIDKKYKCFIIHLERAKKRRRYVDDIISKLNMTTEIITAVDGRTLSKKDISKHYSSIPMFLPTYPFRMNKGEIGCFLSFRKAWQMIVDQELSAGLIFEDDVSLDPDVFNQSLDSAFEWVDEFGYIQFQVRDNPKKSKKIRTNKEVQLIQPIPPLLRCSAQLISNSTAKRLLEITNKFDRPVDTLLQTNWNTKIEITSVNPSGVIDNTHASGGSNLSLEMPLLQKLKQELKRIKYRQKIKKYSNKYNKV